MLEKQLPVMNLQTKIFKDLIEEQLASIPDITFRRLFSGFGIYSGEAIFGLIHGEKLYFHTDDESRTRYKKCGSTFFTAPGSKKPLKNYYEVPPAIIEQKKELVAWALAAIDCRMKPSQKTGITMAKTDFNSVDEYIASQPKTVKGALERVRSTIRKALPGAEEVISYKIPAYKLHGSPVLYFRWVEAALPALPHPSRRCGFQGRPCTVRG
jgi:DNA transformation protein and related proteins